MVAAAEAASIADVIDARCPRDTKEPSSAQTAHAALSGGEASASPSPAPCCATRPYIILDEATAYAGAENEAKIKMRSLSWPPGKPC